MFDDDDLLDKVLNENDIDDFEGFDLLGDDDIFDEDFVDESELKMEVVDEVVLIDDDDFDIDDLFDDV